MCSGQIRERMQQRRAGAGLSSGGYEGGGLQMAAKAMGFGKFRRRAARLPQPPALGITEDGAV